MSKYQLNEMAHACPLPLFPENKNGAISMQIRTERGKTRWMDITPEQFKKIEIIFAEDAS